MSDEYLGYRVAPEIRIKALEEQLLKYVKDDDKYKEYAREILEGGRKDLDGFKFNIHPKLLSKAILVYGVDSQLNQLIEEMAELTVAINHGRRIGAIRHIDIYSEFADVFICLCQLFIILGEPAKYIIPDAIQKKQDRLKERMGI